MNWIALLAVIVSLVVIYAVGALVAAPFKSEKNDEFYDAFVNLVVGFLAITTVYAIIKTRGNTIQLGFLIIALFWCLYNRHSIKIPRIEKACSSTLVLWTFIAVTTLLFFLFHGHFYYAQPINNIPHFDNYVYAFNAFNNDYYGTETTCVYLEGMPKATPYHYIEGWLVAVIANVFSLNYLETFCICLITIFSVIVSTGIIAMTRKYNVKGIVFFLAFFTIFLSAVLLSYSPIKQHMAMGENNKNLISAIFIIGFVLSSKNKSTNAYIWLLCLPLCNVALTPIIMMSLFMFFIAELWFGKNKKGFLCKNVVLFSLSIFIALFYLLQRKTSGVNSGNVSILALLQSYNLDNLFYLTYRTAVNYAVYLPYFFPLIIAALLDRKNIVDFVKEHKSILIFFVISALSGLLCHYAYYPIDNYDSGQLDINITMIFMDIWVLLSMLFVYTRMRSAVKYILLFFWGFASCYNVWVFTESVISRRNIGNKYDGQYRTDIISYFNQNKVSRIGGNLIKDDSNGSAFKNVNDLYTMCFIGGTIDGVAAINLTPMNLSNEQSHWNSIYPQSNLFNQFLSNQQSTDIDSLQLAFMKRHNLGFLKVASEAEIPSTVVPFIDTVFTDEKTGERFAFLKLQQNKK